MNGIEVLFKFANLLYTQTYSGVQSLKWIMKKYLFFVFLILLAISLLAQQGTLAGESFQSGGYFYVAKINLNPIYY